MLGILLTAVSTLATEVGCSVGKHTIGTHERRIYPTIVITNIGGAVLIVIFGFFLPAHLFGPGFPGGLVFSTASLPFFIPRVILEIILAQATMLALARAERSAFGFIRTVTLPLLLIVDLVLGYRLETIHIIGVALTVVGLLILFINHGIRKRGAYITLFTALCAVVNISLYKYDITHFNSVAAEQGIVGACIVIYFLSISLFLFKQNPFALLRERRYFAQFLTGTIDYVTISFAYLFAPASVIASAKRALGVLWAIVAGEMYFHEKHVLLKLGCFALVATGIVLLVL